VTTFNKNIGLILKRGLYLFYFFSCLSSRKNLAFSRIKEFRDEGNPLFVKQWSRKRKNGEFSFYNTT
jgi:hypothetical protein